MTTPSIWINRIILLILWIAITAGVSFYIARNATGDETIDVTEPLPPVAIDERATTALEDATIVPVVSASATVMNYNGEWMLEAPATSADVAYRLLDPPIGVRAQINGGPSGFTCEWVGLGQSGVVMPPGNETETGASPAATPQATLQTTGTQSFAPIGDPENQPDPGSQPTGGTGPSTAGVTMRCAIPDDVRVAAGMSGLMVLQMGQPHDAQALPVTAVVGSVDQGQVVVVHDNGTTEARTVQLGVSDIYNIEITGGLEPDEEVLQTPTQADFAQAEAGS